MALIDSYTKGTTDTQPTPLFEEYLEPDFNSLQLWNAESSELIAQVLYLPQKQTTICHLAIQPQHRDIITLLFPKYFQERMLQTLRYLQAYINAARHSTTTARFLRFPTRSAAVHGRQPRESSPDRRAAITRKAATIGAEKQRLQSLQVEAPTNLKEEVTPIGCLIPHGAAPHIRTTPGRQREIAPARLPTDAWMIQIPSLPLAPLVCVFLAPILIAVNVTTAGTSSIYNLTPYSKTLFRSSREQSHTLDVPSPSMTPIPVMQQTQLLVWEIAQVVKLTKSGLLDTMVLHRQVTIRCPMFSFWLMKEQC